MGIRVRPRVGVTFKASHVSTTLAKVYTGLDGKAIPVVVRACSHHDGPGEHQKQSRNSGPRRSGTKQKQQLQQLYGWNQQQQQQ